ncbi:MAG: YigZ family protein [Balneolaceae bacterium]|nr:YigZ family protein [Balneolaceae bacterium]MBO6546721.1 YigZ family protein [Balneolaceae bacterium]MBO6649079.1 YigZ family protein [Balneolaceae bacterium]
MKTITRNTEGTLRELGSKFLGFLFCCENEAELREQLDQIKKEYPDASHHCYGYRVDPNMLIEFSSDDGEPSGTAGLPILNQLKSAELINTGAVVVRYFGGTKLGKAGLIQAYGGTAELCISEASFKQIIQVQLMEIKYPYSQENLIQKLELTFDLTVQHSEYLEEITKVYACPIDKSQKCAIELASFEHLSIQSKMLHKSYISV